MTFISYAQNYEDVTLFRALKHIEKGFYIDVGAQDPSVDSVTLAFYERGWRGINIEPVDYWFDKLAAMRPEDRNFKVAAAAEAGTLKLFEVVDTGLSTSESRFATKHKDAGFEVREKEVPARRLDDICDEVGVTEIHFLKIDVEGAESAVLAGIDLNRLRPWVILLESTEPLSTVSNHVQWENLLTGRGYLFVHFDGLNRYYVPLERKEQLQDALSTPPNYFDHFVRYSEWSREQRAKQLEAELADVRSRFQSVENDLAQSLILGDALRADIATAQHEAARVREEFAQMEQKLLQSKNAVAELEQRLHAQETELAAVYRSSSWRLTTPLRQAKLLVTWVIQKIEFEKRLKPRTKPVQDIQQESQQSAEHKKKSFARRTARRVTLATLSYFSAAPEREARFFRLASRLPVLEAHLRAFAQTNGIRLIDAPSIAFPTAQGDSQQTDNDLRGIAFSPAVRRIYQQLIQARAAVKSYSSPNRDTERAG